MLRDAHHRTFEYLRLSITDRCNFRCTYCLPNGYVLPRNIQSEELSLDEIRRLVTAFSKLGFWKVRLTGGEPTVRRDIVEIAQVVSSLPGISRVALSTNGSKFTELALPLKNAGVSQINVSIDSLDDETFKATTGSDRFKPVIEGVDRALDLGFESVKINAVLMKSLRKEFDRFLDWVKDRKVSVRFIELMQTKNNTGLFRAEHFSGGDLRLELLRSGWIQMPRRSGDGPAVVFQHPEFRGSVGIIAPYSTGFCDTCNRLRVTSRGALKLCLFGNQEISLRDLLQSDTDQEKLIRRIQDALIEKPQAHFLHQGNYGNTANFSQLGG